MAWSSLGSLGAAQNKTAGLTISMTTTQGTASGNVVVVVVALDNIQTTDGNTTLVSSITDSAGGNTWIRAREFTNGQGAAGAGATVSVWYSRLTNAIASGGTITATAILSITAKCISAWHFGVSDAVGVSSAADLADDGIDPGSMTLSGLQSREYLFFRGIAAETPSTTALTPTTNFTAITGQQTSGGGTASNMAVRGEFRIATATSMSSDPTYVAADCASVFVAIHETMTHSLDAAAEGYGLADAHIGAYRRIAGTASGDSLMQAILDRIRMLAGSAVGDSLSDGTVKLIVGLSGESVGQGSASGDAYRHLMISGSADGVGSLDALLAVMRILQGSAAGSSDATAAFARVLALAGTTAGASDATALARLINALIGSSAGASEAIGDLSVIPGEGETHALDGETAGWSESVGVLARILALAAATSGASDASAALARLLDLAGSAAGASDAAATLRRISSLHGGAIGESLSHGALIAGRALAGESMGFSSGFGTLSVLRAYQPAPSRTVIVT